MFVSTVLFGGRAGGAAKENPREQRDPLRSCAPSKQQQLRDHPLREEMIFKIHLNELRENYTQESQSPANRTSLFNHRSPIHNKPRHTPVEKLSKGDRRGGEKKKRGGGRTLQL